MKSATALGVCLLVVAVRGFTYEEIQEEFKSFKAKFNKSYENEIVEHYRMKIYANSRFAIELHNARYRQGLETYALAVNEYSDYLDHELLLAKTGLLRANGSEYRGAEYESPANLNALPDSVDWRTKGAVTVIKNQGKCGSCWAFSVTGALEGQYFKKSGELVSLSEQELVDCAFNPDTKGGCDGNNIPPVYEYIKKKGIDTESSYPYEGVDGKKCRHNDKNVGARLAGFVSLPSGDESKLEEAVATIGPISVTIEATPTFTKYSTGLYYDDKCNGEPNHAVLVVGYGKVDGKEYWLVKNSWGTSWGEQGYVKMAKNRNNNCNIASYATYPTLTE